MSARGPPKSKAFSFNGLCTDPTPDPLRQGAVTLDWGTAPDSHYRLVLPSKLAIVQESCAVVKITAQCALYGALKMFMTP